MEKQPNQVTEGICKDDGCDLKCDYCKRILNETNINVLAAESEIVHTFLDKYHPKTSDLLHVKLKTLDDRILELIKKNNPITKSS